MRLIKSSLYCTGILILVSALSLSGCASREELQQTEQKLSKTQTELNETSTQLKETKEKLKQKNKRINELKKELKTARAAKGDMSARVSTLEDSNTALKSQVDSLEDRVAKLKKKRKRLSNLKQQNKQLQEKLSDVKNAKTTLRRDNLVITLESDILFDLGKATLKPQSKQTLNKLANAFAEHENRPIAVEGHTDTLPIETARFPNNWHLSAARAVNVVQYLVDERNIAPERFIAAGLGEHHPVATNQTSEGRAKNRRVEIVLYPPVISGEQFEMTP
ncbi:MAG: OmpA family protein [bacterium]